MHGFRNRQAESYNNNKKPLGVDLNSGFLMSSDVDKYSKAGVRSLVVKYWCMQIEGAQLYMVWYQIALTLSNPQYASSQVAKGPASDFCARQPVRSSVRAQGFEHGIGEMECDDRRLTNSSESEPILGQVDNGASSGGKRNAAKKSRTKLSVSEVRIYIYCMRY